MHSYLKDDVQYSGRKREKNRLLSVYSDWKSKAGLPHSYYSLEGIGRALLSWSCSSVCIYNALDSPS